ncbi:hypothetical protein AHiyo8_49060 [Arthrobacter sp. Hiyo8]|nr:hypothetical protein AHiyo8_49060 [Arthrobacter sp. Hiyo8]
MPAPADCRGTVCATHGGSAGHVKAAAARRVRTQEVEADTLAVIAAEGVEGVTDPLEALALLASEALAMKSALAARVNALSDITTTSKLGVEALKVEVQLYERAMDRAGRFLDLLAKSGIEERRMLITEAQAQLVFEVMNRVFNAIGLTAEQRALLPTVVPRELERMQSLQVNGKQATGQRVR